MAETAQLRVGDETHEIPIVEGSEGERALDIQNLRSQTGLITLDPGYANTGACRSAITFIDGEKGILRYRGIAIEELAEHSSFLEVAYLLIYEKLPTRDELEAFIHSITYHTMIHEDFKRFFAFLPKDTHPMAACAASVGALSAFYPDSFFGKAFAATSHGIYPRPNRAMFFYAFTHQLQVVKPFNTQEGSIVHKNLTVNTQHIKQADIPFTQGFALFFAQIKLTDKSFKIIVISCFYLVVAIEFVQELLQIIEAHFLFFFPVQSG